MLSDQEIFRALSRIRHFEQTLLDHFHQGIFPGTTHTYLGQEANAVGVLSCRQPGDIVFSNHRCHGHFLAYGGDMRALFAELMGKSTGVCGGRGGSQHLHWRDFYSNGVQGGILPIATGMGLAEKYLDSGKIVFCFLGDGTLGQGVVYEALNMAALWGAPVFYVLENNYIAQTTPLELALAGGILERFKAFAIPALEVDSADVLEIVSTAGRLAAEVREERSPRGLVIHTQRFGPHSKGDDTRNPEMVAALKKERDPLKIHASRMEPELVGRIDAEVEAEVAAALEAALEDPGQLLGDQQNSVNDFSSRIFEKPDLKPVSRKGISKPSFLGSINRALHQAMLEDRSVILLGQDILDPYGGAFKVTRGLSSAYADRVFPSPISEAGMVGIGAGMALRGLHPIVEIMFGDFLTLAADQLINHAAKFRWMYNQQVRMPLVIRTPMGGRRAYGPTHSQSLEKIFLGVPGLKVLAASTFGDAGDLLLRAIQDQDPVLFIEHKLLYPRPLQDEETLADYHVTPHEDEGTYPGYSLALRGLPDHHLTMVAYGYMADLALEAALNLAFQQEIFAELVVMTQLSPFHLDPVIASARRTRRVLVVEEGSLSLGWGAEVIARVTEALGPGALTARRVAARDVPIPASQVLEAAVLPEVSDIITAAQTLVGKSA
jgi:2-oxoisovalerate dehydrogenase E1 component